MNSDLDSGGGPAPPPDPNLILILNLLVFGAAGYWLLGERRKAIIAAVAWMLGLVSCGVISGLVAAFAAWDGYRRAVILNGSEGSGPGDGGHPQASGTAPFARP